MYSIFALYSEVLKKSQQIKSRKEEKNRLAHIENTVEVTATRKIIEAIPDHSIDSYHPLAWAV